MPAVVDASALLALLGREPGWERVAEALPEAVVSAVNLSEVAAKLVDTGMPEKEARAALDGLGLDVVPFDGEQAYGAGFLRPATRRAGLSLGDRACLQLAAQLGAPVLTTDRAWGRLQLGVEVRVIR